MRLAVSLMSVLPLLAPIASVVAAPTQLTPEQKQQFAVLRATAVGDDRLAARGAFEQLKAAGEPAKQTYVDAVRVVLTRDKGLAEAALRQIAAGGDLAVIEAPIVAQQKAALAKIEAMTTPQQATALRAEQPKLAAAMKRLNEQYAARSTLIDTMRYRPELLKTWAEIAPKVGPNPVDNAAETKLAESAKAALGERFGSILVHLQANPTDLADPPAEKPEQRGLLDYRLRRRVEAWHRLAAAPAIDPGEYEAVGLINNYRESLGLPPIEFDPRLIQASRRHCKEMTDQKYFGPESPTENLKDGASRMKSAGYDPGPVWAEALAKNCKTGTQVFWMLFDVPAYHKAMTSPTHTTIGVGRWGPLWSVTFAAGPRLSIASAEAREQARPQGENLPQQGQVARAQGGTAPDERPTDPTQIRVRPPGGAGQVPGIGGLPAVPGGF